MASPDPPPSDAVHTEPPSKIPTGEGGVAQPALSQGDPDDDVDAVAPPTPLMPLSLQVGASRRRRRRLTGRSGTPRGSCGRPPSGDVDTGADAGVGGVTVPCTPGRTERLRGRTPISASPDGSIGPIAARMRAASAAGTISSSDTWVTSTVAASTRSAHPSALSVMGDVGGAGVEMGNVIAAAAPDGHRRRRAGRAPPVASPDGDGVASRDPAAAAPCAGAVSGGGGASRGDGGCRATWSAKTTKPPPRSRRPLPSPPLSPGLRLARSGCPLHRCRPHRWGWT